MLTAVFNASEPNSPHGPANERMAVITSTEQETTASTKFPSIALRHTSLMDPSIDERFMSWAARILLAHDANCVLVWRMPPTLDNIDSTAPMDLSKEGLANAS